jgi:hypothetical protein
MGKFTLTATYFIGDNLEVNVCLKPSSDLIDDYISTYQVYTNEEEALINTPFFIEEMTPLLFHEFKEMDNVPIEIRDQFEL